MYLYTCTLYCSNIGNKHIFAILAISTFWPNLSEVAYNNVCCSRVAAMQTLQTWSKASWKPQLMITKINTARKMSLSGVTVLNGYPWYTTWKKSYFYSLMHKLIIIHIDESQMHSNTFDKWLWYIAVFLNTKCKSVSLHRLDHLERQIREIAMK